MRERFDRLILSLSDRLLGVPAGESDAAIGPALAALGRHFGADRAYLCRVDEGAGTFGVTHEWCADGIEPQIDGLRSVPCDLAPWGLSVLRRGEEVNLPLVAAMPPAAAAEQEVLEAQGVLSSLAVPVLEAGRLTGFVGLETVRSARTWDDGVVRELRLFASLLYAMGRRLRREQEFDPRALLAGVVASHAPEAERRGLALVADVAPDLPPALRGDAARYHQIVSSLLDEALRRTEAGHVRLAASLLEAGASRVWVRVTVADTGTDRASRGAESGNGTWLGTAIRRRLVLLMGGREAAERTPGGGGTVAVDVPFAPAGGAAGEPRALAETRLAEVTRGDRRFEARLLRLFLDEVAPLAERPATALDGGEGDVPALARALRAAAASAGAERLAARAEEAAGTIGEDAAALARGVREASAEAAAAARARLEGMP